MIPMENIMAAKKTKTTKDQDFAVTGAPDLNYHKFFLKFKEIDTLPVTEWNVNHFIGYFCRKYEEYYGSKYTFKFQSIPSKCYEAFKMKAIISNLEANKETIKDYIDWIFSFKIKARRMKLTSIGYLADSNIINEFKFSQKKKNTITRTSFLPPKYIAVLEELGISNISTYGELSFLKQALEVDQDDRLDKIFHNLTQLGLNVEALDKIA